MKEENGEKEKKEEMVMKEKKEEIFLLTGGRKLKVVRGPRGPTRRKF